MNTQLSRNSVCVEKVEPLCPIFGTCGGCAYQDLPYEEELRIKEEGLRTLFHRELNVEEEVFEAIVPSPAPYHYRSRLDLGFRKTKKGEFFMGFMPQNSKRIVSAESCAIAREEISDFLPELKRQAEVRLPENYQVANLVIRTGDDGRIFWGGIGRRSLQMDEKDYFWTEIHGKKIFYSLDTFFQANLSILPDLMEKIARVAGFDQNTYFFDLYAGAGLFGIYFAEKVNRVFMIEECKDSTRLARFNTGFHKLEAKVEILTGKVENELPLLLAPLQSQKSTGIVDPPRKGLLPLALEALLGFPGTLLYLSCQPESLARDLKEFVKHGWTIEKVIPFDFFPKTVHLETLVKLCR